MFRLALLGDPVSHSRSPAIHIAALAACGLEGSYEPKTVGREGVVRAFSELREGSLHGFNVTMPHKALAASLCDRLQPDAARAGSVNTVTIEEGEVVGYSTDIGGITDVWERLPPSSPVLILGAGGASAAACIALQHRPLYIATRRYGTGKALGERLQLDLGEVRWGTSVVGAVVVNCTPLGMKGESLPQAVLELANGLLDMAYGSGRTPAATLMLDSGKPVVEGLDLLLAQAARSFRIWTACPPPLAEMRAAAENC